LTPLGRRHTAAIRASAAIVFTWIFGRTAPLAHPSIPDDLHIGIARERARQQLERGKVTTSHDNKSLICHWSPFQLAFEPQTALDRHAFSTMPSFTAPGPSKIASSQYTAA
jgi:hypothetical protein